MTDLDQLFELMFRLQDVGVIFWLILVLQTPFYFHLNFDNLLFVILQNAIFVAA